MCQNEKLKVSPAKLQLISSASGTAARLQIDANAYREKVEPSIPLCLCDPNLEQDSKLLKHLKLQFEGGMKNPQMGQIFGKLLQGDDFYGKVW